MQKAKGSSVVVEGFLNYLLSNFKTLTEIGREFIFSIAYLCCLLLIFTATSLSRGIYTLLAFIDLGFPIPIIHSLETLKTQQASWAVSALYQPQSHEVWLEVGPGAWSVDRASLCPIHKINIFIPYRWLTQASQLLPIDCRGESAPGNLDYLLGSLKCTSLCWTSVPTVKL